jgi:hypothetical protein
MAFIGTLYKLMLTWYHYRPNVCVQRTNASRREQAIMFERPQRAPSARPALVFSTVEGAHIGLIEVLAVSTPSRILHIADAQDLEERAEHLQQVLGAVLDYVGAIVADTGHVANGGSIDQGDLLDSISDAAGDVAVSRLRQALGSSDGWTPRGGRSALFQLRRSCEAVSQKQAKRFAARFDLVVCRPFVNSENDRLWKTNCHSRIMAGSRAAPAFPFSVYRY